MDASARFRPGAHLPAPPRRTVFIVDDEREIRESLTLLLRTVGIAAESFPTAAEFWDAMALATPAALLLDMRLPDASGLDVLEAIGRREINLPTIVISGFGDVPAAVRAMRAGAVDFVTKPFNSQMLLERVQEAIAIGLRRGKGLDDRRRDAQLLQALSRREQEILDLIVLGHTSRSVGQELGIAVKTVENYRARLMRKMDVTGTVDLVRRIMAVRNTEIITDPHIALRRLAHA